MRLLSIVLCFLLVSVLGFSQNYIPYYNLINEAEFDIYNEDFEAALDKINQAFKLEEPRAKDCYLLAYCLDHIDAEANRLEVDRWLLDGSSRTGFLMYWFEKLPLNNEFGVPFYETIEENISDRLKEAKVYRDTLIYFTSPDQELSQLFADSISVYYDSKHEIFQYHLALLNGHEAEMQAQFLIYLKENGYPGIYKSGGFWTGNLLNNMSEPLYEEYKVVLLEAVKRGEMEPYYYGTMVDVNGCFLKNESYYFAVGVDQSCLPNMQEIIENRRSIGMSLHFKGPRHYLWMDERWLIELTD